MASPTTKQIQTDLSPILILYTDGTVDRLILSSYIPPSPSGDPVSSRDTLNPPAKLYLPNPINPATHKLPILLYFHGGGFLVGSPFSSLDLRYMEALSSSAQTLIISVKYRLAPGKPSPGGIRRRMDCPPMGTVCSHIIETISHVDKDPWITNHGDFSKIFIGGDSAGANIAHNIAMRAGSEPLPGDVKVFGTILSHPYFWGSIPIGGETKEEIEQHILHRMWGLAYPDARDGIDNPMINPTVDGGLGLSGLAGLRMMVCVAEKDVLRGRGIAYVEGVRKSGWKGDVEVVEVEGEDHCFHLFDCESDKAKGLIKRMASFISH